MGYAAVTAFLHQIESLPDRDLLTIVLAGGCNLRCSWCAVSARRERLDGTAVFSVNNYRQLIDGLAKRELISGVAIVGDEPLLPAAWPVARDILDTAHRQGLPSALITNGTWLAERSQELALRHNQLLVTLDGVGAAHDAAKRTVGAYAGLERGLVALRDLPELRARVTITSIVQPDKYEDLHAIPAVLARNGIKRWALSPLIQFRRTTAAQLHPRLFPALYSELPKIMATGREAGLDVMIDDGLSLLLQADAAGELRNLRVARPKVPDIRVLRMAPDGTTVRYTDLLDTDASRALRWDGKEPPAAFHQRLYTSGSA